MTVEREALLVETVVPLCGGIGLHLHVGELDKQDKPFLCPGHRLRPQWARLVAEGNVGLTHLL
jgi:hypothetical protein